MKIDDKVRLVKVHPAHPPQLKARVGETGTVLISKRRKDAAVCVRFPKTSELPTTDFWVKPKWLEKVEAEQAPSNEHVVDPETGWLRVVPVSDVELAFPVGDWQPDWDVVPAAYRNSATNGWNEDAAIKAGTDIFFGLKSALDFKGIPRTPLLFRDGSPATAADGWRMIQVIMASRKLKHEHKEALLGWAIDSVFERFWFAGEEPEDVKRAMAAAAAS